MARTKHLAPLPLVSEDAPYFDLRAVASEPAWDIAEEGELAVDVVETAHDVVVRSAIAGVKPEDLEIHVTADTVTIRGKRQHQNEFASATTHIQECHWGAFSRTIVLPHPIRQDDAMATIKSGILTVVLPKSRHDGNVPVHSIEP